MSRDKATIAEGSMVAIWATCVVLALLCVIGQRVFMEVVRYILNRHELSMLELFGVLFVLTLGIFGSIFLITFFAWFCFWWLFEGRHQEG